MKKMKKNEKKNKKLNNICFKSKDKNKSISIEI